MGVQAPRATPGPAGDPGPGAERRERTLRTMGTTAHLVTLGGDEGALERAARRLDELEGRWSRFLPDSELSRINRGAGRPVIVSEETFDLVAAAIEAWRWSDGRFDPAIGSTMVAAGYDRPRQDDAGMAIERSTVEHVASPTPTGVVLDPYPGSITVPDGVALDLGGLAKGAAADLVARELLADGVEGCSVSVGGDVRLAGRPPGPGGWLVAIECVGAPPTTVGVVEGAVCTSTRLLRTWTGPRGAEHHLRDPRTGGPIDTGLSSVTVIAARALQAEVLATTAFLAGPDAAGDLLAGAGATGRLVLDGGAVVPLAGLDRFVGAAEGAPARPGPVAVP